MQPDIEEVSGIRMDLEAQAGFYAAQERTQADLLTSEGFVCEMAAISIHGAENGVRSSLLSRESTPASTRPEGGSYQCNSFSRCRTR
jgi:DNA-binding FadR family transcriptional regulator